MPAIRSLTIRVVSTATVLALGLGIGLYPVSSESASPPDTSATTTVIRPVPAHNVAAASPAATPAASPATLPNGATSLSEVYGDWTVSCSIQSGVRQCDAKQEQVNQQNRQMVLAIELAPVEDKIEGVALLPFGLALDSGVSFQIDEQPTAPPIHFRTCLPTGCVVPLTFDARTVALLRNGTTLKAKVVADGGGEAVLSISLKGLAAAIDRRAALAPSERNLALKQ